MGNPTSLSYARETEGGIELALHVQPRSSVSQIAGKHDGRLKVRVASAPVAGAANDEVLSLLAERFGIPRRRLSFLHGEKARRKLVRVEGLTLEQVAQVLGD